MRLTGMKTKIWPASRNMNDWSMKQAESIEFLSLNRSRFRLTSLHVEEDIFPRNALQIGDINRIIFHSSKKKEGGAACGIYIWNNSENCETAPVHSAFIEERE